MLKTAVLYLKALLNYWLSHVTEEAANAGDDLVSIYSAAQIIMTQTLAMIYNELIELMGGLITEGNENE